MNVTSTNIPTLFSHNHASNLYELENGDILCAWFSGTREGKADISILLSRLTKGSDIWSDPVVVSSDKKRSEQNPILFKNPNGELWLLYTSQNRIYQDSAVVKYQKSLDDGQTWSEPDTLFNKAGSFVRHPPVITENKEIILPAYYSVKSSTGFLSDDYSVIKISRDFGVAWEEVEIPGSKGLVHMSLIRITDSHFIGLFRSRKSDNIYFTESKDSGRTWKIPEKTDLPNNNSSIQAFRLKNGHLALLFNNINAEVAPPKDNRPPWFDKSDMESVKPRQQSEVNSIWGVIRSPLSLAVSEDNGRSWSILKDVIDKSDLEEEVDYPEFSYPSIIQSQDGTVHITFTFLRKYIQHQKISDFSY